MSPRGPRAAKRPDSLRAWWGLVAGLGSVSILLLVRVRARLRRQLERIRVDDEPFGDPMSPIPAATDGHGSTAH